MTPEARVTMQTSSAAALPAMPRTNVSARTAARIRRVSFFTVVVSFVQ